VDASNTRVYGGSGLGLSISKNLVELMGGEIGVDSEAGRGSDFWFILPFEAAAFEDRLGAFEQVQVGEGVLAPEREPEAMHILVVEDNIINRRIAMRMLEKLGYRWVDSAANGQEALDAVEHNAYDVILMDVQMPVMDGLTATAHIRQMEQESGAHVHIIAMTAHAMEGDRERVLAAGMDDYLSKPVRAADLAAAIEQR
jgi:CheY-like chemotaxis protein